MKVFAIDRDYYVLKQYEDYFADSRHTVRCFSYMYQLTEAVKSEPPDVIIVESEIPAACEFVRDIRELHRGVRFVFAGNKLTAEQLNISPDGWLHKPVSKEKIKELLFRFQHSFLSKFAINNEKEEAL